MKILIFFFLLAASACGYRWAGSGNLPAGIASVFVPVLENRTDESGLETMLTNELVYELTLRNKLAGKASAEAVLFGRVTAVRDETISRKGERTALERRVSVTTHLTLTHRDKGVVWEQPGLESVEAYSVGASKTETDQNRRDALENLARRYAELVYSRLTENF